jgi:hypothetical protein
MTRKLTGQRKMKPVMAWTVVAETGDAMSPTTIYGDKRKAEQLARWLTNAFGPIFRIARVRITEARKGGAE